MAHRNRMGIAMAPSSSVRRSMDSAAPALPQTGGSEGGAGSLGQAMVARRSMDSAVQPVQQSPHVSQPPQGEALTFAASPEAAAPLGSALSRPLRPARSGSGAWLHEWLHRHGHSTGGASSTGGLQPGYMVRWHPRIHVLLLQTAVAALFNHALCDSTSSRRMRTAHPACIRGAGGLWITCLSVHLRRLVGRHCRYCARGRCV
jgi:hypothetical protein